MNTRRALKAVIVAFCLIIIGVTMFACGEKTFTVTFMDGENVVQTLTVEKDKEFALPVAPEKEGYRFVGWYTDAELKAPYAVDAVTADFTLYAKYDKQEWYISVNSKGGSKVDHIKVAYRQEYTLEIPEREGYDFVGYTYDNGTEDVEFPVKGVFNLKQSIRVSANWKIKELTVNFYDGETLSGTKTVKYGETVTTLTVGKKGYTFDNWYTDKEFTNAFNKETAIKDNVNLYAKFTANVYKIVFDADGGNAIGDLSVAYQAQFTLPTPEKTGYDFLGWYNVMDDKKAESGAYEWLNDVRLKAKWAIHVMTVNFYDGETRLDTKTVKYGETVTPSIFDKEGYTFENWYTDKEFTNVFNEESAIKDNVNLYAKFTANVYKIVFDADGGNAIGDLSVAYQAQFTLPTPEKTGYDFLGWYNVMDDKKAESGAYEWLTDVRLKAKWAVKKYAVTFRCGTEVKTEEVEYNKGFAMRLSAFTVENGYEAVGFFASETFEGEAIDVETYKVTAPVTLYVKVMPKTFHITVMGYANDGYDVVYNTTYTLETSPVSEGEIFEGYFLNGQTFASEGTYVYTDNITVEARFKADPEYNKIHVKLYDENDKLIDDKIFDKNSKADLSDVNTEKTGYTFKGWFNKADHSKFAEDVALTEPIDLYAKYEANTYTITVVKNNGEPDEPINNVVYGETYTLPELTKEGYTFDCYRLDDATEQKIPASGKYAFAHDITVKACWTINTYKVEFMVGADVYAERTANHGSAVVLPDAPAREGHTFAFWMNGNGVKFNTQTGITENTVLYASFTANVYDITVVCNNGTERVVKATYGETYTIPAPVNVVNHKFNGYVWKDTDTKFDAEGTYVWAENIAIEESWERVTIDDENVTFVNKGSYFKERENLEDEFTYVFVTGGDYNLNKELRLDETGKTLVTLKTDGKGFTVGNVTGEFTLTIIGENGVTYERHIKIVKQITSISYGNDYNDYANGTHMSAFVNQDKETMTAGVNDLRIDIRFIDNEGKAISYADANAIVTVNTDDGFSVDENGIITFAQTALGKEITVTVRAKYDTREAPSSVTYTYKLNNGVNVYTSSELYVAYGDLNVHEVNILRNIEASITDPAKQCEANGKIRNDHGNGIYVRNTNNLSDTMTINGNYFFVDGMKLDRVGSLSKNPLSTGYEVANIGVAMFVYRNNTSIAFNEEGAAHNGVFTVNNLRLQSNMDYNQRDKAEKLINTTGEQLIMSDTYNGFYTNGGTMTLNNVNVSNTLIGVYGDGGVSATDNTKTATCFTLNDCRIDKNWANGLYLYNITTVTLNHTEIGASGGAAIHFDDKYQALNVNNQLTMDNYSASNINNWISGNEAWFVAYGMTSTATTMKTQIETGANKFGKTILKSASDGSTQLLNFAVFVKNGNGETGDWNNDCYKRNRI